MIFVYVCEHYCDDYKKFIENNAISGIEIIPYESLCVKVHTHVEYPQDFDALNSYFIGPRSCELLTRYPFDESKIIRVNACYEHLIEYDFASYLINKGGYIISKGWLRNWESNLSQFDIRSKAEYAQLFGGFCKAIVLLTIDTTESQYELSQLEQMSEYLDIPYEVVRISDRIISKNVMNILNETISESDKEIGHSCIHSYTKALSEISECQNMTSLHKKIAEYSVNIFRVEEALIIKHEDMREDIQARINRGMSVVCQDNTLYMAIRVYDKVEMVIKAEGFSALRYDLIEIADYFAKAVSAIITKFEIESNLRNNQSRIFYEDKMSSIGQMAGNIAHEINNPLSFIASNMSVLQVYLKKYKDIVDQLMLQRNELDDESLDEKNFMDEDIPMLIEEMDNGVDRIGKIVQRFRSITNIDTTCEVESLDPKKFIEDIWFLYGKNYEEVANVELELQELPPVRINRGEIALCMYDVIENAKDAIESKDPVTKGYIEISIGVEEQYLRISVSDNGIGVNEEIRHRVFEPFFTTKEIGEGIGLGLSFAYDVIRHGHNGDIQLFTNEKGLTECKILLPFDGDYM